MNKKMQQPQQPEQEQQDACYTPANDEAEYAVLAIILASPPKMAQVEGILHADHFYTPQYRAIYAAMTALFRRGISCAPHNVRDELRRSQRIAEVVPPNTEDAVHLLDARFDEMSNDVMTLSRRLLEEAGKVIEAGTARALIALCQETVERLYAGDANVLAFHEARFFELAAHASSHPTTTLAEALDRYLADYDDREQDAADGKPSGTPTGFPDLDRLLGGLRKSRLYTLLGSTGGGKTALALNMALHAIAQARHVLFFSLEMDEDELVQRLLSMETHIDQSVFRDAAADPSEKAAMHEAAKRLARLDLHLDDRTYQLSAMRSRARSLHLARPLDLIVVDYLGLMEPEQSGKKSEPRYLEVGELSKGLKRLARELKVPVLALAQLNRAADAATEPQLEHIYESAKIGQDSDVVIFAHIDPSQAQLRNNAMPYRVNVIVRKNRNGRLGRAELWFRPRLTKFERKEWSPQGGYADDGES